MTSRKSSARSTRSRNETGDIATYVKLLRVAMLLPAVFAISFR